MKRFLASVALLLTADTAFAAPGVGLADLSSVILSLTLVIGFIFGAAWLVRRAPFSIGRGNGPLKVLAALPLGAKERLLLVEARGTELLIAVSPAGIFNVGTPSAQPPVARAPAEPVFTLPEQS
ncbi:MAG: flagellar biosynthetic protein FliO [Gammaproteobacteria bacterium]